MSRVPPPFLAITYKYTIYLTHAVVKVGVSVHGRSIANEVVYLLSLTTVGIYWKPLSGYEYLFWSIFSFSLELALSFFVLTG